MHRIISIFLLALATLHAGEEKISLLSSADKLLSLEQLQQLAPGAKVAEEKKDKDTSFTVSWENTSMRISYFASYDQQANNQGMYDNYSRYPAKNLASPDAKKFLKAIPAFKYTYGMILPKGFDGEGTITQFLLRLATETKSYMLTNSSFYDQQGFRVMGPVFDPPFIGPAGKSIITLDSKANIKPLLAGTWNLDSVQRQSLGEDALLVIFSGTRDFQPDGTYTTKAIAAVRYIPKGEAGGPGAIGNYEENGTWSIEDDIYTEKYIQHTLTNIKADSAEIKEFLNETFGEDVEKIAANPPRWIITRDPDTIITQVADSNGQNICITLTRVKEEKK